MNSQWLTNKLRSLHANQSGAIAFMVLAGILMSLMMALVVYDTTPVARTKIEVQTASDVAAWSHSAVEARSMNMIAFVNVAKRVLMGQALYYFSLWAAWAILMLAMIALLVILVIACVISCIFGGCGACNPAIRQAITVANTAITMGKEAADLFSFYDNIQDRLKADLTGLHNYQTHFQALTPWWAWGESWRRGLRNGAYVSGWPVPDNYMDALSGLPAGLGTVATSSLTDRLPIDLYPDYGELCVRSIVPDLGFHLLDYLAMYGLCVADGDCDDEVSNYLIPQVALYLAAGPIAAGLYVLSCGAEFLSGSSVPLSPMMSYFGDEYRPFQIACTPGNTDGDGGCGSAATWTLATSNIVFAYRPGYNDQNRDLNDEDRDKYNWAGYKTDGGAVYRDFTTNMDIVYKPDGFLGMARSEISFQGGDPDMWHPSWSTRMRPIALPGEWAGYPGEYRMISAFNDTVPYIFVGSLLGEGMGMLGIPGFGAGTKMGAPNIDDLVKAELAFDAMTRNYVEGVAR